MTAPVVIAGAGPVGLARDGAALRLHELATRDAALLLSDDDEPVAGVRRATGLPPSPRPARGAGGEAS